MERPAGPWPRNGSGASAGLAHTGIEALAHGGVAADGLGVSQRLDPFHEDLPHVRLSPQNLQDFLNKFVRRCGVGIGAAAGHQFGGHVGRRQFNHLCRRVAQLPAQRLGVGVQGGPGDAVSLRQGQRNGRPPGSVFMRIGRA